MMNKYKVFLRGKNFLIRQADNNPRKQGFNTTLFIGANSEEEAARLALEKVRFPCPPNVAALFPALNAGNDDDPAVFVVDKVELDDSIELNDELNDFVWFTEEKS